MAFEPIGLEAVMGTEDLTKGMAAYMQGVTKMNEATEKTAGNLSRDFDTMGSKVGSVAKTMGTVLVGATAGAAVALGGFAVKGISQAIDMEKQMSTIAAIMGKTKDQVKPLSDEIVKLGLDPSLMVDATQAADAIQQLAKNGLSMDQILQGAAKSTVLLANATGADFGDAASTATAVMKLFNIQSKDMDKAVSGIVSVTTNSKLTFNDYAQALANGGGAATAAGVSFNDFNAVIAGTSSYFSGGGDAATSFKTFITQLQPATADATKEMIRLGLATKDGKSKFFDAKGEIKSMADISGMLAKALDGMSDAQQSATLKTLFGADASRTAIGLAKLSTQGFKDLQAQMAKTDAADQAATKMDNLAGIIEITKGAIDAISLTIGQAFLPLVTDMAKAFGQFVSDKGPQLIEFFKTIAAVITQFVSGTPTDFPWEDIFPPWLADIAYGVSQTFEGVLKVIQDLRTGAFNQNYPWEEIFPPGVSTIAKGLSDAIQFVMTNIEGFKGALLGVAAVLGSAAIYSGIIALTAAIGAISLPMVALVGAGALLGAAWANDWGGIQEVVKPILTWLGTALTNIGIVIKSFTSESPGVYPWKNIFPDWLADALHNLGWSIEGVKTVIADFQAGVFGFNYDWEGVFPPGLSTLAQGVSDVIQKVVGVIQQLQAAFAPLTASIQANGAGALTEIQAFATGNETEFTNVKAIWDSAVQSASNMFSLIVGAVSTYLPNWIAGLSSFANEAMNWLSDAAGTALNVIGPYFTALISALGEHLPDWIAGFYDYATEAVTWIGQALPNAILELGKYIAGIVTYLTGPGKGTVASTGPSLAASLLDWIDTQLIPKVVPAIGRYLAALTGALINIAGAVGKAALLIGTAIYNALSEVDWLNVGTTILTAIVEGLKAIGTLVSGAVKLTTDAISTAFTSIDWAATGSTVLSAILAGLSAIGTLVSTAAKLITDSISLAFTEIDWATTGTTVLTNILAGLSAIGTLVSTAAKTITDSISLAFTSIDWATTGTTVLTNVMAGLSAVGTLVSTAAKTVTDALALAFTSINWATTGTTVLTNVMAGLSAVGTLVSAAAKLVTDAIALAFTSIDWAATGTTVLTNVMAGLSTVGTLVSAAAKTVTDAIATAFTSIDWVATGTTVLTNVLAGLSAIGTLVSTAAKLATDAIALAFTSIDWKATGATVLTNVLAGLSAVGTLVSAAAKLVTDAIVTAVTGVDWKATGAKVLTATLSGLTAIGTLVSAAAKTVTDALVTAVTGVDWKATGAKVLTATLSGLTAIGTLISTAAKTVTDAITTAVTGVDWKATGTTILTNTLAGLVTIGTLVIDAAKTVTDAIAKAVTDVDWKATGTTILTNTLAGLVTIGTLITDAAKIVTDAIITAITSVDWKATGTTILTTTLDGLKEIGTLVTDAVKIVTDAISKNFTDVKWSTIGKSIIDGIVSGITGAWETLKEKIGSISSLMPAWMKKYLEAESPSKVFARIGGDIVKGLIVGIDHSAQALYKQVQGMISGLLGTVNNSIPDMWLNWSDSLFDAGKSLSDFTDSLDGLVTAGGSLLDLYSDLAKSPFEKALKGFEHFSKVMQSRKDLLELIRKNNLNPSVILGGENIASMTPLGISAAVQRSLEYVAAATKGRLEQEQKELQRIYNLQNVMKQFNYQLEVASELGANAMNFFQQTEFDQISIDFAKLGEQLNEARKNFIETGDQGYLNQINSIITKREKLVREMQALQGNVDTNPTTRRAMLPILNQQSTLLDKAKALGMDVANVFRQYFQNTDDLSSDALRKMSQLQDAIDTADFAKLKKSLAEKAFLGNLDIDTAVSGVASAIAKRYSSTVLDPLIAKLHEVVDLESQRNAALNQYNSALSLTKQVQGKQAELDFLQEQLDLMGQASATGVYLKDIFTNIAFGAGANITDLLKASNKLMDLLVTKAREKFTPEALALADRQTRLANLQKKLDLLTQAREVGLTYKDIFGGLAVGVEATTADLIRATAILTEKLIKKVKEDLEIGSPSKVFARIGANVVEGLGLGMTQAFSRPLLSTVPTNTISNYRSVNFTMGGVSVYSGMDEIVLENRMQRLIERAFG